MKELNYHFLVYPETTNGARYIGVAWSNDGRVCLTTTDYGTYHEASSELSAKAEQYICSLTYFQGEHTWDKVNGVFKK